VHPLLSLHDALPILLQRVTERVLVGLGPVQGDRALSNSTVVAGAEATMVVDTKISAELVEPVRAAAVELGSRPVAWVLNTHGDRSEEHTSELQSREK